MGKIHKRFNWKSRLIVNTVIDESEQKKIKVDFDDEGHYDASNAFVLPSAKRKTKKLKDKNAEPIKLLSKKQRKKLMKINERKLKKSKRENILEELKKVQAKPKDMAVLTSLQTTQTLGRKLFCAPAYTSVLEKDEAIEKDVANHLKWKVPKAVKRKLKHIQCPSKKLKDLNTVQSDSSSSSDEDSENELTELSTMKSNDEDSIESKDKEFLTDEPMVTASDNNSKCNKKIQDEKKDGNDVAIIAIKNSQSGSEVNGKLPGYANPKNVLKKLVRVQRDPELQKQRLKLPILSEEHTVMEAVNENNIILIVGQTGSGKTTQVPQFLYEAGYASNGKMIGVTEPRRVAAISMAERVGFEMGLSSSRVSYQIRFEGNASKETEIKFMTDGVLFKEVLQSPLLEKYSAIIIDEAHERSIHSDILIGLLSRIVPRRKHKGNELKLIIMSATLRIEDFTQNTNLFKASTVPVVHIQPRMFDVTVYFNKETDPDYCSAAYRKICKVHRQLPDGGILVFLTGQQEIRDLSKLLKDTFPLQQKKNEDKLSSFNKRIKEKKEKRKNAKKKRNINIPEINLNDFSSRSSSKENDSNPSREEGEGLEDDISPGFLVDAEQPMWVLPLYALLPRHKQRMVFESPPEGTRLCVLATNVAETSLTIPNIKYVVDSGKNKEKVYDPITGVSSYHVTWCSKASANQRAGRAGRTSEGFCYRLYSSAVFNDEFPEHSVPDIRKRPLDDVVLTMKALRVPVMKFSFPTPPDPSHLSRSLKRLTVLGALKQDEKILNTNQGRGHIIDGTVVTEMGTSMAALPVAPRFAKMILYSHQHEGILPYIILVIAALSVQEVLIEIPFGSKKLNDVQKRWESQRIRWGGKGAAHLLGDLHVLIQAVLEAEQIQASFRWCQENGIRHAALLEIRKLRRQLTNELSALIPNSNTALDPNMKPPTDKQACIIAEVVFMGSMDQIARRVEVLELNPAQDKKMWRNAYRTLYSEKPVYISSSSVLHKKQPKYVMYQDIYESTKVFLRGITVVDEAWLVNHGGRLVDLGPPLDVPQPKYSSTKDQVVCWRKGEYGPDKWPLSEHEVPYPPGKELFKWVAYFFLIGDLWPPLRDFAGYLHDPKTLISPISLRFREKRENLIRAFMVKNITSAKSLKSVWEEERNYLKSQYLSWFENEESAAALQFNWPPLQQNSWFSCGPNK